MIGPLYCEHCGMPIFGIEEAAIWQASMRTFVIHLDCAEAVLNFSEERS